MSAALEETEVGLDDWAAEGLQLGAEERASESLMWRIGDWWNSGRAYGARAQIVTAPGWTGPKHQTCRIAGMVAAKFDVLSRLNTLSFEHHRKAAALDPALAEEALRWAADAPEPRSVRELQATVKKTKRAGREAELAEKIRQSARGLGHRLYGVIYADPPWRFEPYSRVSGMDRAAENHYPTMDQDELANLELPAAEDCILFCWATLSMLPAGMAFLSDHGFTYRTSYIWVKPGPGLGYWSTTDQAEILLVGTRGDVPAPAPGEQPPQCMTLKRGQHSEKPDAFAVMIERMYPTLPKLEMFARKERPNWDSWGAEAP